MVWILAISAETTRRAAWYSSSGVTSLVADHAIRARPGCADPESSSGVRLRLRAERVHEHVVLAREHVVVEAHADRPVVRERDRFLAGPRRD